MTSWAFFKVRAVLEEPQFITFFKIAPALVFLLRNDYPRECLVELI